MSIKGRRSVVSVVAIGTIAKELSEFSCVGYLDDVQLSDGLLSGAIKSAAVIACSDMGAWVPYVCSSPSVKLFLFQNFGHNFDAGGMVETIVDMDIRNVFVYGHSDCEYLKFLAKPENSVNARSEDQRQLYAAALKSGSQSAWKTVGQFNVLNELKQLLEDPIIGPLATSGKVTLHGWFYDALAAQIEVFDPREKAFIAVTE